MVKFWTQKFSFYSILINKFAIDCNTQKIIKEQKEKALFIFEYKKN